jgi:hypothetical protein
MITIVKKWYKCPFPVLNIFCHDESVATDMVYSDTLAIDSGATCAQLFVEPILMSQMHMA